MATNIETLALEIVNLADSDQKALFKKISSLALKKGLIELSEKYTERLKIEKRVIENQDLLLKHLQSNRDQIAEREYGTFLGNS